MTGRRVTIGGLGGVVAATLSRIVAGEGGALLAILLAIIRARTTSAVEAGE